MATSARGGTSVATPARARGAMAHEENPRSRARVAGSRAPISSFRSGSRGRGWLHLPSLSLPVCLASVRTHGSPRLVLGAAHARVPPGLKCNVFALSTRAQPEPNSTCVPTHAAQSIFHSGFLHAVYALSMPATLVCRKFDESRLCPRAPSSEKAAAACVGCRVAAVFDRMHGILLISWYGFIFPDATRTQ